MFSWFKTFKRSITPFCGLIWERRHGDYVSFCLHREVMTSGLVQALKFTGWSISCKYKQEDQLKNQVGVAFPAWKGELLVRGQSSAGNWLRRLRQPSLPTWEEITSQSPLEKQNSPFCYLQAGSFSLQVLSGDSPGLLISLSHMLSDCIVLIETNMVVHCALTDMKL